MVVSRHFFHSACQRAHKSVTWHNERMDRAALALALVACGARTDLGGARADASVVDASNDVAIDVAIDAAPSKCPPVEYGNEKLNGGSFAIDDVAVYYWLNPYCEVWRTTKDGTGVSSVTQAQDCSYEIGVDDEEAKASRRGRKLPPLE